MSSEVGLLWLVGNEVREKGKWRQVQGLAWDELLLPFAALVASLTGTLRV